jgi:hypothetical protein
MDIDTPIPYEIVEPTILDKFLKDPNNWMVAVDMDGVICEGEFWGGVDPQPKQDFIDQMWKWYQKGAHIVIYTARQPRHYARTHGWLIAHEVPFHGITMCMKPGADIYLDDKCFRPEEVLDETTRD